MSIVNTNMMSLNAQRHLSGTSTQLSTAMERLSSGLRVNSSKDDAAGLAIAERMTAQIRGSTVGMRNASDGISYAQTAEGALDTMGNILQRMRDLGVQSMNGSNSTSDRSNLQKEFAQLQSELTRIVQSTTFNGQRILNGDASAIVFQVGANASITNQISAGISVLSALSASNLTGSAVAMSQVMSGATTSIGGASKGQASIAVARIDGALNVLTTLRAKLGAVQNRMQMTISNLRNNIENQTAARSRIMDADFATETANLSRAQILQQAGTAMLSQANQAPQTVLSLLR